MNSIKQESEFIQREYESKWLELNELSDVYNMQNVEPEENRDRKKSITDIENDKMIEHFSKSMKSTDDELSKIYE